MLAACGPDTNTFRFRSSSFSASFAPRSSLRDACVWMRVPLRPESYRSFASFMCVPGAGLHRCCSVNVVVGGGGAPSSAPAHPPQRSPPPVSLALRFWVVCASVSLQYSLSSLCPVSECRTGEEARGVGCARRRCTLPKRFSAKAAASTNPASCAVSSPRPAPPCPGCCHGDQTGLSTPPENWPCGI